MIHDFNKQLKWSEQCSDEPFWNAVYRQAFPNMVSTMRGCGSTESQHRGVDRVILLSNDQLLRIDEKKRTGEWQDILLEYLSVDTRNIPGWIEKDLAIDYVAYAFMNSRRVYLLPWHPLRLAWSQYGRQWKEWALLNKHGFTRVKAQNDGYSTWSVAVPIKRIYSAMNRASVIEVRL